MLEASELRTQFYKSMSSENEAKILLRPFFHLDADQLTECKFIKEILIGFNYWLKLPESKLQEIFLVYDMACVQETIVDDIEDGSTMHCSAPAAHVVYGIPSTICITNYINFIIIEKLLQFKDLEAIRAYAESGIKMQRGTAMDIYWRDNFICPTEEDYIKMAYDKAGGFLFFPEKLMQLFSSSKKDLDTLVELVAAYIQIMNDYVNLVSDKYRCVIKDYCEDLTEGKFSFPVIHAIRSRPEDNRMMDILKQRTDNIEVKKYALSLLDEFGSLEYTRQTLKKLRQEIAEEIERIGDNPVLLKALDTYDKNILG